MTILLVYSVLINIHEVMMRKFVGSEIVMILHRES